MKIENWLEYIAIFPKLCIGFDVFILILAIFSYDFSKAKNTFLVIAIGSFLFTILKLLRILSTLYAFLQFKRELWKALVPIVTNSITLLILVSTPYIDTVTTIRRKLEFQANKPKYEEVVKEVRIGTLQSDSENGYIRLLATLDDFILVDQKNNVISVFFDIGTSFRSYEGYMYRSDNSEPPSNLMEIYWFQCEYEEENWYFCSSL